MNKLLIATLFATVIPFMANSANDPTSPWSIGVKTVKGTDKTTQQEMTIPVAIFLYSLGKVKIENDETGAVIQAVCTIKRDKAIRLSWKNMPKVNSMDTTVYIDGRVFRNSYNWSKQGEVFYRMAGDSTDLSEAMKRGKTVSIKFNHIGKRYDVSFNLNGFTKAFNDFNKKCGF